MSEMIAGSGKYCNQVRYNAAKMGAYYTDLSHCRDIGKMLRFSTKEQTCCLEPSIGDGSAVITVTGAVENDNVRIFGVELNDAVAGITAKNPNVATCLQADFLSETIISNHVFTFCFANPPYSNVDDLESEHTAGEKRERLEKKFLERISNLMKAGGILVWVVPHRVLIQDDHASFWMSRYQSLAIYKFRKSEFDKYGQVVIVGRRRHGIVGILKEDRQKWQESIALDKLSELPETFKEEEMIDVPVSEEGTIKSFRTKVFNPEEADEFLNENPNVLKEMYQAVGNISKVAETDESTVLTPLMPLRKADKALLATCGIGSGYAGTDGVDLHLQRGSVEEIEEHEFRDEGGFRKEIVRTKTKVHLTIIENSGMITDLA